ncbi:hypothetical protein PV646_28840 [Streptomyces sp. ID05-26A]|nr:hypothetical protein [Streptomyces sp. ID05-26A]
MPAVVQGLDPWFIDKKVGPAEARAIIAAMLGHNASGVGSEGGLLLTASGRLSVNPTTPSASMQLAVSPGACVVPRTNQHAYVAVFDAASVIDVPAANSNPRIDTVIVRVRDGDLGDASNGVSNKGAFIEIVTGVPNAVPVPPDLSAIPGCLPLRDYLVPAGAGSITAVSTDRRVWTRALGGVRYSGNADTRAGAYPYDLRVSPTGQFDASDPANPTQWIPLLTAGARPSFTPVFRYGGGSGNPSGPVGIGTGGRLAGRYTRQGRIIRGHAELLMGVGGGGGTGIVTMDLPAGLTAIASIRQRAGSVSYYHPGADRVFDGSVWVSESGTILDIYLPGSATVSNLAPLTNANPASPSPGTGVPLLAGQYSLGDNVRVWIDFEFETTT